MAVAGAVAGHILIGDDGQFLDVDAGFCAIMLSPPERFRGRRIFDVTAPADRAECARAIAGLRATGRPFVMIKRFVRDDGTLVWVRNSASIAGDDAHGTVAATVEPVDPPVDHDSPAVLLDVARFLIGLRRDRTMVCDRALFADHGWDTVLATYVAEAEGRAVGIATLAQMMDHAPATVERWVKALLQHGVLEIEYRNPSADSPKAYRLTAETHRRMEAYLGRIRPQQRELAMQGG